MRGVACRYAAGMSTHGAPVVDSYSGLPRSVGVIGALGVMVGVIIGSGIFRTPADIAGQLDSVGLILGLWAAGGALALLGALTFAELATLFPQSGGVYVFIREGFGRVPAFVFGWTYMLISKPAAAAGIAVLIGETFNALLGTSWDPRIITSVILVVFTVVNICGVRAGAQVAVVLTALKIAVLLAIVALGLAIAPGGGAATAGTPLEPRPLWGAIVAVMAGILWTYDGWSDVGSISGEVKNPQRNLPRIYLGGTLLVTGLYLAVNAVYMHVIPLAEMRGMDSIAPEVMSRLLGPVGATVAGIAVIVSAVGSTHSSILTGARITFQQSRDGLLFRPLSRVHPRFATPDVALWVQLTLSLVATWWLGTFERLAGSFVFTMWIFYGLAGAAIFVLRVRRPDSALGEGRRTFRCPGYPVVPAIFVASALAMTVLSILDNPRQNLIWIGVLLAGVPVYFVWTRLTAGRPGAGPPQDPAA